MEGMVSRARSVDGLPTSLCDLGYCDVGLDDGFQTCNHTRLYKYHDDNERLTLDEKKFPDMRAMNDKAHHLGLTSGFYLNNCICAERRAPTRAMYEQDVETTVRLGFDGVKIDHCGTLQDLKLYAELFNQSGRSVTIENCHWGESVPTDTRDESCPWNYFRTSNDIMAVYGSVVRNLQTTVKWAENGISRPGCWAYPDMLEVGVAKGEHGKKDIGLSLAEARSHFGAWCIVSSPLVISMDVTNVTVMDQAWPIIANKEAIHINQAWHGHSGSPFKASKELLHLHGTEGGPMAGTLGKLDVPSWQYFYKPLSDETAAVLLMNHANSSETLTLDFKDVPGLSGGSCSVRDVWEHKDLGRHSDTLSRHLPSHDSAFLVLRCGQASAASFLAKAVRPVAPELISRTGNI